MQHDQEFKDLTDQELFDKMLGHHVKSEEKKRTDRSRWHHKRLYEYTKRMLWERLESER